MRKAALCILMAVFFCSCAIHQKIQQNDLRGVVQYVEKGGDIDKKSPPFEHTPLYVACYYGFTDIVQYLCDQGADVNARAVDGSTALMCTAQYNYPDIAQVLVEAGADLNLADRNGHTALYYAKQNRFYRVSDYLSSKGAKVVIDKPFDSSLKNNKMNKTPQNNNPTDNAHTDKIRRKRHGPNFSLDGLRDPSKGERWFYH